MKFAAVILLAFVATTIAAPTSISNNNMGNIVNVGVSGVVDINNDIDETLVNAIVALVNSQGIDVGFGLEATNEVSEEPKPKTNITPEMIESVKGLLAKH